MSWSSTESRALSLPREYCTQKEELGYIQPADTIIEPAEIYTVRKQGGPAPHPYLSDLRRIEQLAGDRSIVDKR
jgi:hypothetical protein